MCLILFAWEMHPKFPLILAANRDEFYDRPSAPADFWEEAPEILAGRDLKAGGTWLGITRSGRWAALTNYRDPAGMRKDAPSRGHLVSDYLRGKEGPEATLRRLAPGAGRYNGFSLLLGLGADLFYFSSRGQEATRVAPGVHGVSNRLLDTRWPKVEQGQRALERLLGQPGDPSPEALFDLLGDRTRPPASLLPDTGVGLEWERILSPRFVESPGYGTRSSMVLLIDRGGRVTFVERVFNGGSTPWISSRFHFRMRRARDTRLGRN